MFIGFWSLSLWPVLRTAYDLCFVARQEHLHCYTQTAHSSCVPACADSSVLFLALRCGECCSCSIQVLITCPSYSFLWAHYSKAYITVCQMLGICTCFRNVFFVLLNLYVDDPMCNKRILVHALLATTLKRHMSAATRMCCGYSVFWGFCGLGFSEFLKVLLHGLGGFVVFYFAYEGIFNYWNLLSTETFCGIKLYCNDQKFPCCMQEDGLDSFLRSLQHFISAALYF